MIFRIDDVSVNTDRGGLYALIDTVRRHVPGVKILLAVSPLVHDVSHEPSPDNERPFPKILLAMSDHRKMFSVQRCGIPGDLTCIGEDAIASHGLVHVDHRLMGREAQELSIVTSCSLVESSIFVPPFNKWNKDTESVCAEHGIELVKFEDGWKHVNYNVFDPGHLKWYMHTHDTDAKRLGAWFGTREARLA